MKKYRPASRHHHDVSLHNDQRALVGVQEDIIALSVVLVGFSMFIAFLFTSVSWVEEQRSRNAFDDVAPRLADELALDAGLRHPGAEPGILRLQAIGAMEQRQNNPDEQEERVEFIREHSLHEVSYLVIISTLHVDDVTADGRTTFSAGLTQTHSHYWGSDIESLDDELASAEQVRSIRRPVNIVDSDMPERIAPGYVLVITWR